MYLIRIWLPQWFRVIPSNANRLWLKDEHDDLLENLIEESNEVSEQFHKKLQVQECVLKEFESHKSAGNPSERFSVQCLEHRISY